MFVRASQLPDPATVLAADDAPAWVTALRGCQQDARWHPEGDVHTHTRLALAALDELLALPACAELGAEERAELRWAVAFHDAGKADTTRVHEDGSISSHGHARRSAIIARRELWRYGLDPAARERICGMARWHMLPGHLLDRANPRFALALASQSCRLDRLSLLAEADSRGRQDDDGLTAALERVALFRLACEDEGCWNQPFPFASAHARMVYFEHHGEREPFEAFDDTRGSLHLISGLPGVGKDRYIAHQLSLGTHHVSIDAWRQKLGVGPGEYRTSAPAAFNELRAALRTGTDCVFNATNLIRDHRAKAIRLARDYGYRIRIVQLETTPAAQQTQNAGRELAVPDEVIERMLNRWEAPTSAECHQLDIVDCTERQP